MTLDLEPALERREVFVAGEWRTASGSERLALVEPATAAPLVSAPAACEEDVDAAVAAARRALGAWGAHSAAERAAAIERLADALARRGDELAELVSREMGMPLTMSRFANVEGPVGLLRYYAGLARELADEEQRVSLTFPGRTVVRREPVGVAALIAPWNYPIILAISKLAPALAAGCSVVLKPSPETSLSAGVLAEATGEARLPAGTFNLVTGGARTGDLLVRHPGVDHVAFTGSTAVGRRIGAICGERLTSCTLELGGKSAAIVLEDADLPATIEGLGALSFMNAGQTCFAMTRVLAPRSRYAEVVDALAQVAAGHVLGDPLDPATTLGPLVSDARRRRVHACVEAGVADGARVAVGGRPAAALDPGFYYEPTVFADATNAMSVAREEIFGPVVTVIPYAGEEEAVAIANDSAFGLAGSVWTSDPDHGLDIARGIQTGTFGINQYVPDLGAPWGGCKDSGIGREYGPEGLAEYRRTKSIYGLA
jgi:aldehyde dehydrogenase (NAD+)